MAMAGARGGRWGSSTPTRRKSGEIRGNPGKSGLPKPTDYKNKKINTVRERERDILYI